MRPVSRSCSSGPAMQIPGKSVHLHLNDGLFAEVLRELAASVKAAPAGDAAHREALAEAALRLHQSLVPNNRRPVHRHN